MRQTILDDRHRELAALIRRFIAERIVPHYERWESEGRVPREVWREAGELGLLGMAVPEEFGGGGDDDVRLTALLTEELARAGVGGVGFPLHTEIVGPLLVRHAAEAAKRRWLPAFCSGEAITALAVTEPQAGSDLSGLTTRAVRDGDEYIVDGAKTFVSNGLSADLIVTAARTGRVGDPRGGLTLLVVEGDTPGLSRNPTPEKIGLRAQDTAELFFDAVRVPAGNVLAAEGAGLRCLTANLARERLSIAVAAVAGAEAIFAEALAYAKSRSAFGRPIGSFQHWRFELAEMATVLEVARTFVDHCLVEANAGRLDAVLAAQAKWWTTDLQRRLVDTCLQLHGGIGFSRESRVGRAFVDTRMMPLYGGTNEVMKEIIGRSLGV